ncbi:bifunctional 5,10-methylenetetrahydrofolate dehydrogenase/5,10-methenyltetrahydrofolate cyclohydrolase [Candidatus Wolfebacteria bacterium]|nr:bifunctional 5,10-methylenetetrahydrofolate dehydrogenase/5,10-methenyltetrahydrofolate cyclohydrolase [Candidatus Wolfebacteria bacterium]
MNPLDGKAIAQKIFANLKAKPTPKKFLAAILVGKDPASASFLKQKEKTAVELDVDFRLYRLDDTTTNDDLREEVGRIARQGTVGGVIVQLPLPKHLNKHYILNAVPREKDVDVLGERAIGAFYTGRNSVVPPAVGVLDEILRYSTFDIQHSTVAVIGLGFLVGKPIATWLMGRAKEILLFDKGSDFSLLKNADLVISGAGSVGLVKPEMLKDDASVIDFGYGASQSANGKSQLHGDFDASQLTTNDQQLTTNFYTPTPGGTGPILVAKLFENFFTISRENG